VLFSDRHLEILSLLTANAGQVMSKDELIEAAWKDVAVADNSIEQAISTLRKALGSQPDGAPYIETLSRRGYRFAASVERQQARQTDASLDGLLAPYRAFVEGRAALETLDREAVVRARRAFEDALSAAPDYPAAHIGMANACVSHAAHDGTGSPPPSRAARGACSRSCCIGAVRDARRLPPRARRSPSSRSIGATTCGSRS